MEHRNKEAYEQPVLHKHAQLREVTLSSVGSGGGKGNGNGNGNGNANGNKNGNGKG